MDPIITLEVGIFLPMLLVDMTNLLIVVALFIEVLDTISMVLSPNILQGHIFLIMDHQVNHLSQHTIFHCQGMVYMLIHICHLCQCEEKLKTTLTFTYVKVVYIFTYNCKYLVHLCEGWIQHTLRLLGLMLILNISICQDYV